MPLVGITVDQETDEPRSAESHAERSEASKERALASDSHAGQRPASHERRRRES